MTPGKKEEERQGKEGKGRSGKHHRHTNRLVFDEEVLCYPRHHHRHYHHHHCLLQLLVFLPH
ncbi:hypothetical protein E2C01_059227 [Portunus trituberculatus]|uniref:Uncharacterized protein n=1 Tax=Portunus trituberculatus TaxID=210409 RepID=A0A5B7GXH0_PORTR|nr:hypothetical protein [Portunus trituberculatus]